MPSPCTGVCTLDAASHHCLGCRRTLAEIAAWPTLPDHARMALLRDLKRRQVDRA